MDFKSPYFREDIGEFYKIAGNLEVDKMEWKMNKLKMHRSQRLWTTLRRVTL